jgi:anti-sigma B factor antagonist
MPFELTESVHPNARVVAITGDFDLSVSGQAEPVLSRASSDPDRALVVDLTDCTFMDSTALALIVGAARALTNGQSKIAIACLRESPVRELLRLTGIDQTVPVLATLAEALEAALATE